MDASDFGHAYYRRFRPPVATFGQTDAARPLKIAFLIGSTDISGGTYVILQHALHAVEQGHEVTLVPFFPAHAESTGWHPAYERLRVAGADEVAGEEFDLALATWWRTVYELWKVRARNYAYFVQSVESRFYPPSEEQVRRLADETYGIGLPVVTISSWLQWFLALEHDRASFVVRNGIDKRLFSHLGPALADRVPGELRVLVEGPVDVPMKNVPRTVELAREAEADEVWLLTSSPVDEVAGVDHVSSRVPVTATAAIYRSCDVLVKLSYVEGMAGPPLEMFHCGGTAVSWDVTGHEEYLRNGVNGFVAELGDEAAVVEALRTLRKDERRLARMRRAALETAAKWPSWDESSARFRIALEVLGRQAPHDYRGMLAASERGHDRLP